MCGKKILFAPALTKKPIDTLGAGDAFCYQCNVVNLLKKTRRNWILGNVARSFAVNHLGHQKYLNKEFLLNYIKTYLNI